MNFKEIQELIKLVNKSNLTELKMEDGDFKISIRTKHFAAKNSKVEVTPTQIMPVQAAIPASNVVAAVPASSASEKVAAADGGSSKDGQGGQEDNSGYIEVKSPIVGTFYRSPAPEKPPYIKVGDRVDVGSVVCIVEAMKLFNEIESEVSGKVVKVLIEDASPVEYDQVLFLLDPKG